MLSWKHKLMNDEDKAGPNILALFTVIFIILFKSIDDNKQLLDEVL